MDDIFLISLALIFLAALIGIFVKRRSRDACLKDFARFHVTVELDDGDRMWGVLAVFPNGLELFYKEASVDREGHEETSTVLFADAIAKIRAIYRYHDELTEKNQERRRRDIDRTYHPGLLRRTRRSLGNFMNTFRDAFNQSLGVLVAQAKKGSHSEVLKSEDKRLTQIGQTVLGAAANAYEPILERYIGRRVVVESKREDGNVEHPGILKAYTRDWIEVLGCRVVEERSLRFARPEEIQLNRDMDVLFRSAPREDAPPVVTLVVENHGDEPLTLDTVRVGEWERAVDVLVARGESHAVILDDVPEELFADVDLDALPRERAFRAATRATAEDDTSDAVGSATPLPDIELAVRTRREADLCLPRKKSVLSHGGEPVIRWYQRAPRS